MRTFRILILVSIVAIAAAFVFVASGGSSASKPSPSSTRVSVPRGWQTLDGFAATVRGPVDVYATPDVSHASAQLGARTSFGSPTTMLVLAANDQWLKVSLPTRPNGATG